MAKQKRNMVIAVVAMAVVVAAVATVAVRAFLANKANEEAHRAVSVPVAIQAEGYAAGGTGAPLLVQGEDLDGTAVSELVVASPQDGRLALKRGSYAVEPAGPPVSGEGVLYLPASKAVEFEIDEAGIHLPEGMEALAFAYDGVPPAEVTDEQMQAVRDWMAKAGSDADAVEAVLQTLADARQAELDRIAEEKRKAEEEARARAEAERLARRDVITGSMFGLGAAAPNGLTSVTFADGEVVVVGPLRRKDESTGSGVDKTWHFGIDESTRYGFVVYDGFHEQSLADVADMWSVGSFPGLTIELEDGMVRRMYQSA